MLPRRSPIKTVKPSTKLLNHPTVKTNMVRKKNLAPGTAYRFRVRARDRIDWNPFLPPAVVRVGEHIKTTHPPLPCVDAGCHLNLPIFYVSV